MRWIGFLILFAAGGFVGRSLVHALSHGASASGRSSAATLEGFLADVTEREQMFERMQQAQKTQDGLSLMPAEEQALWQRVQRARSLAQVLAVDEDKLQQIKLYEGLLIWQASENYPDRVWQITRALREANRGLKLADESLQRLASHTGSKPFADTKHRITALQDKTTLQLARLEETLSTSQAQLRNVAIAVLREEKTLVRHALATARLAQANLYQLKLAEGAQ